MYLIYLGLLLRDSVAEVADNVLVVLLRRDTQPHAGLAVRKLEAHHVVLHAKARDSGCRAREEALPAAAVH